MVNVHLSLSTYLPIYPSIIPCNIQETTKSKTCWEKPWWRLRDLVKTNVGTSKGQRSGRQTFRWSARPDTQISNLCNDPSPSRLSAWFPSIAQPSWDMPRSNNNSNQFIYKSDWCRVFLSCAREESILFVSSRQWTWHPTLPSAELCRSA